MQLFTLVGLLAVAGIALADESGGDYTRKIGGYKAAKKGYSQKGQYDGGKKNYSGKKGGKYGGGKGKYGGGKDKYGGGKGKYGGKKGKYGGGKGKYGGRRGKYGDKKGKYGGGKGKYGGRRDKYGGKKGKYGGGKGKYGGGRGKYGGKKGKYGGGKGKYGGGKGKYGGRRGKYGDKKGKYGGGNRKYGGRKSKYGGGNRKYGGRSGKYGGKKGKYGGKKGTKRRQRRRFKCPYNYMLWRIRRRNRYRSWWKYVCRPMKRRVSQWHYTSRSACRYNHGASRCYKYFSSYRPRCGRGYNAYGCCWCLPKCPRRGGWRQVSSRNKRGLYVCRRRNYYNDEWWRCPRGFRGKRTDTWSGGMWVCEPKRRRVGRPWSNYRQCRRRYRRYGCQSYQSYWRVRCHRGYRPVGCCWCQPRKCPRGWRYERLGRSRDFQCTR